MIWQRDVFILWIQNDQWSAFQNLTYILSSLSSCCRPYQVVLRQSLSPAYLGGDRPSVTVVMHEHSQDLRDDLRQINFKLGADGAHDLLDDQDDGRLHCTVDGPVVLWGKYNATLFIFLHVRPWISPWIKSISNELDITIHVIASQLSVHCDVIGNRLWRHQQDENTGTMCKDCHF